jgi:hypothetical protein
MYLGSKSRRKRPRQSQASQSFLNVARPSPVALSYSFLSLPETLLDRLAPTTAICQADPRRQRPCLPPRPPYPDGESSRVASPDMVQLKTCGASPRVVCLPWVSARPQ